MKVFTVVGARPQFIKAAVVSREIAKRDNLDEIMVHTGQHYDKEMSQLFFDELNIPKPKINLGVAGGTHAQMTGRMMAELERAMEFEAPDIVLIYGDTNSTLAGTLAAVKLGIPICHVEAGGRTFHLSNPEEANRICADHLSSIACAVTSSCMKNLKKEGLSDISVFTGDPMYDAFLLFKEAALQRKHDLVLLNGVIQDVPERFYYLTCHRQENTSLQKVRELLSAMSKLDYPVVYPVHPRACGIVSDLLDAEQYLNILFVNPVGYLTSVFLVSKAEQVITDSGGLQREAFFAGKKCTTLMDFVVVPETMVDNRNVLAQMKKSNILEAISRPEPTLSNAEPFGDGSASIKICDAVMNFDLRSRL